MAGQDPIISQLQSGANPDVLNWALQNGYLAWSQDDSGNKVLRGGPNNASGSDILNAYNGAMFPDQAVNGQTYAAVPGQGVGGPRSDLSSSPLSVSDAQSALAQYGVDPSHVQDINGSPYAPRAEMPTFDEGFGTLLKQIAGAVGPALAFGLAAPAFGLTADAVGAGAAGAGAAEGVPLTIGNAAGINLPGSGFLNVGADAAGAGAGGAAVGDWGALTGPLTTGVEGGLATAPEAAYGTLTGPLTAGAGAAAGGGLASLLSSIPPGTGTAAELAAKALEGGNGPVQPGYNTLDPSTYGGTDYGGGANGGLVDTLSKLFPNANLGGALSGLGQGVLGYLGSQQQASALKDIYNQQRADRLPALGAFNTALTNPDTFYQSAPAMGAADSVLRGLSVHGNPALSPGDMSKAAAYNLGGYNDYLRGLSGPAFGTAPLEAQSATGAANAASGGLNAIGYGLGGALNPPTDLSSLFRQFGLGNSGLGKALT